MFFEKMYSRSFVEQWTKERQTVNTVFFKDNIRKIDAILIFKMNTFSFELETFLKNMKKIGIQLEFAQSTKDKNTVFCKVHAPLEVLTKYADVYNIYLRKDQKLKFALPEVPCKFMETLLNSPRPDPNHPVSKRAWPTISKAQPTEITWRERSVIMFAIMDYVPYGFNNFDIGYKQLLHKHVLEAAYPLHDGKWEWSDDPDEPLNDRQILAKYWGSIYMVFKQQPLIIIEKYFGYEIGIYFAWLGFYNKMLMFAAIMGVLTFLSSVYFVFYFDVERINTYCHGGNRELCAEQMDWVRMKFTDYCIQTYIAYVSSNLGTYIYSCLMIVWCTIFKELWKRQLNIFNTKWEKDTSQDFMLRPQFVAKAKLIRPHKYTGQPELYISTCERIMRYALSTLGTMVMLSVLFASLIGIICLESFLKSLRMSRILITFIICCITGACMTFLEKVFFDMVAAKLANVELPRTDLDFEKSCMIKSCIYAFINNYGRIIYIAFLKGRFDIPSPTLTQVCMLPGCVFEVICMMLTIFLFKPFLDNFMEVHRPLFFVLARKLLRNAIKLEKVPRWEREYDSNPLNSILGEMEEMVIQYGLVVCFAASCPLVPLFAFMHNMIEIKVDSIKLLKYYKRPIERKQITSIGVWFDLFETMTYVVIIVNAFFMAYTCNIVYLIYDYINVEKVDFFSFFYTSFNDCFISCPDNHDISRIKFAYEAGTALFLIVVGFVMSDIISFFIPDMPRALVEYVHYHEQKEKDK